MIRDGAIHVKKQRKQIQNGAFKNQLEAKNSSRVSQRHYRSGQSLLSGRGIILSPRNELSPLAQMPEHK